MKVQRSNMRFRRHVVPMDHGVRRAAFVPVSFRKVNKCIFSHVFVIFWQKISSVIVEEVPLYTPKGKRIAQANPYPPGWHPEPSSAPTKQTKQPQQQQQRSNPPAPPAVAKKDSNQTKVAAATAAAVTTEKPIRVMTKRENVEPANINKKIDDVTETMQNSLKIRDDVVELSKRLKRLRRRLRELDVLEEKINSGEIVKPQKDQLEKISRRIDFEKEIDELEKQREELKAQGFKTIEDDSWRILTKSLKK